MSIRLCKIKVSVANRNQPERCGKGLSLHWLLLLGLVLAGCQVTTEEATLQAVSLSPSQSTTVAHAMPTATHTASQTATIRPDTPTPSPTPWSLTVTSPPTATLAPTTLITVEGFLLYEAINNEESWLYALRPGGSSRLITAGQMLSGQPFSPDGTMFIIDTNDWSNPPLSPDKVFILDLKTGELLPLNLLAHPRSGVFWSADGNSLLYIDRYSDDIVDRLIIYDIGSGENRVLVEMERILLTAGWAVDGETVAFVARASAEDQYDLFTVNSQTLERQQLTNDSDVETMILWSPAAPHLLVGSKPDNGHVFEMWPWGIESLYLFDAEQATWQLLTDIFLTSEGVSWSPDGNQIVFSDAGLLCLKDLATMTERCPLADVAPYNEYFASFSQPPVWSADGAWVAFQAYNGVCDVIHFLELATNRVVVGDLGCDLLSYSPISPIYWSSADWSLVP